MSGNNKRKSVERLCEEYPAVRQVIREIEVLAGIYGAPINVRASVQRGDATLMYWRPEDVRGNGHYMVDLMHPDVEGHPDLEGIARTSAYLVLANGELGGTVEWAAKYDDDDPMRELFLGDVFDTSMLAQLVMRRRGLLVTDEHVSPVDDVKQVMLVALEEWYPAGSGQGFDSPRTVRPVHLRLEVVLYKEPRKGWRHLRNTTDLFHNVPLHGWRFLPGISLNSMRFRRLNEKLLEVVDRFQEHVWLDGLGHWAGESLRSGALGDIQVYTYEIVGEVSVHLQRGAVSLTIAAAYDSTNPRMRVRSVDGTFDELTALVDDTIARWAVLDSAERESLVERDGNVELG